MKQCPKCEASISDTAKFCVKCGCNIKKYEEEHADVQEISCPDCGTKFSGGSFCPECGYNVNEETTAIERQIKALSVFEYDDNGDDTYTLFGLKNKNTVKIIIPEGVVAIADGAFEECEMLSVILPEGLVKIGDCAFKDCKNLLSINIPASLLVVGYEAFAGCEMLDITLPASVCKVGADALLNTVQDRAIKEAEVAHIAEEQRRAEEAETVRVAEQQRLREEAERQWLENNYSSPEKRAARYQYLKDILNNGKCSTSFQYTTTESRVIKHGFFGDTYGDVDVSYTEHLVWIMLDADEEKSLWMCTGVPRFLYDRKKAPPKAYIKKGQAKVKWSTSPIRQWLGEAFYSYLGTDFQSRLLTTEIHTDNDVVTRDTVFLLSPAELEAYKPEIFTYGRHEEYYSYGSDHVAKYWLRCASSGTEGADVFQFEGKEYGTRTYGKFKYFINGNSSDRTLLANDIEFQKLDATETGHLLPVLWLEHPQDVLDRIQEEKEEELKLLLDKLN